MQGDTGGEHQGNAQTNADREALYHHRKQQTGNGVASCFGAKFNMENKKWQHRYGNDHLSNGVDSDGEWGRHGDADEKAGWKSAGVDRDVSKKEDSSSEHNDLDKSSNDWMPLSHEERTRHDMLFFSQRPVEGLLPGERARSLFLQSRLSLQVLSQVWNLVDKPHDNMLDAAEFAAAVHLIQARLHGRKLPEELPPGIVALGTSKVTHVQTMTKSEVEAYEKLFDMVQHEDRILASLARQLLLSSGLDATCLANVWDLSDVDRDGALSRDEFSIACHLVAFLKAGNNISGPVNTIALLPHRAPKSDLLLKKIKLAELENWKHKLMQLKERRKLEVNREQKRLELCRRRFKYLCSQREAAYSSGLLSNDADQRYEWQLLLEEKILSDMQLVVQRLKKAYECVRGEAAKTIVEEQVVYREVKTLAKEAEALKKKRERNSLIKDLDPFHQLYEDRKEEKQRGSLSPHKRAHVVSVSETDVPFDWTNPVTPPPLSGDELFVKQNNNETFPTSPAVDASALTAGFGGALVRQWSTTTPQRRHSEYIFDEDKEDDPTFMTVPVTEHTDDHWSLDCEAELILRSASFVRLQADLHEVTQQIRDLTPRQQVVFRNPEDYQSAVSFTDQIPSPKRQLAANSPGTNTNDKQVNQRRDSSEIVVGTNPFLTSASTHSNPFLTPPEGDLVEDFSGYADAIQSAGQLNPFATPPGEEIFDPHEDLSKLSREKTHSKDISPVEKTSGTLDEDITVCHNENRATCNDYNRNILCTDDGEKECADVSEASLTGNVLNKYDTEPSGKQIDYVQRSVDATEEELIPLVNSASCTVLVSDKLDESNDGNDSFSWASDCLQSVGIQPAKYIKSLRGTSDQPVSCSGVQSYTSEQGEVKGFVSTADKTKQLNCESVEEHFTEQTVELRTEPINVIPEVKPSGKTTKEDNNRQTSGTAFVKEHELSLDKEEEQIDVRLGVSDGTSLAGGLDSDTATERLERVLQFLGGADGSFLSEDCSVSDLPRTVDRAARTRSWYDEPPPPPRLDEHTVNATDEVKHRVVTQSRSARIEKARTWCVNSECPVPPPRRPHRRTDGVRTSPKKRHAPPPPPVNTAPVSNLVSSTTQSQRTPVPPPRSKHKKRIAFPPVSSSCACTEDAIYENVNVYSISGSTTELNTSPTSNTSVDSSEVTQLSSSELIEMQARKQQLDRLRAQFFPSEKQNSEDGTYTAEWASSGATMITLGSPNTEASTEHRTVLHVGGNDEDYVSEITGDESNVDHTTVKHELNGNREADRVFEHHIDAVESCNSHPVVSHSAVPTTTTAGHIVTLSLGSDEVPTRASPDVRKASYMSVVQSKQSPYLAVASTIPASYDNGRQGAVRNSPARHQLFVEHTGGAMDKANTNISGGQVNDSSTPGSDSLERIHNADSIDECSIGEQNRIKEHWEGRISLEDQSNLYPRPPPVSPPLSTTGPHGVYCSDNIDRDSIADLGSTKQHWEAKVVKSDEVNQHKSRLTPVKVVTPTTPPVESAIDREIRLAREREEALKREHSSLTETVTIVTDMPSKAYGGRKMAMASSYHEMTEADRGCESIIEREIREQQEREIRLLAEHEKVPLVTQETIKTAKSPPGGSLENRTPHTKNDTPTRSGTAWRPPPEPHPSAGRVTESSTGRRHMPAHESMIARELREQSEREAELRAHWHSMGLQISEPADADTPFDPEQLQMRPHPRGGGRDSGSCVRYGGGNTAGAVVSGTATTTTTGNVSIVQNGGASTVHAYNDDVDGEVRTYTPQAETAIEREIRLTQAREHELRSTRGLPPLSPSHPEPPPSPQPVAGSRHGKTSAMQRLASGRLQAEIRRDQEKELALRNEGKIKTTSDELTGLPPASTISATPSVVVKKVSRGRTESKIEEELREMQQREEELRRQRDLLQSLTLDQSREGGPLSHHSANQHSPGAQSHQTGPHSPRVPLDQVELLHRHDTAAGKAGRRRSGLAAQWERTCAENQ